MTVEIQSASTSSAETNTANSSSPSCELECVTNYGMVVGERLSEEPIIEEIHIEKWAEDAGSSCSNDSDDEDCQDCQSEIGQEIVAPNENAGCFGNIVVKNSSEVHFGNNTYYKYQGPVTIKQFVYENEHSDKQLSIENGNDNLGFQPEIVTHIEEECIKREENQDVRNVVKDSQNDTKSSQGPLWLNFVYKKRKLLSVSLLTALIIILILLIVLLVNKKKYVFLPQWWDESNTSGNLNIIPRAEWLAESPKDEIVPLALPVPNVIILCTSTDSCTNRGKCTELMRYVQRFHINTLNWADIAYNFLVGGDGYVYEGRGWHGKGAHSHIWNSKSIGIGFIGNFEDYNAPKQQISAAKLLIEKGVKDGYIAQNYKLYAHLQVSNTKSPGKFLYEDMKTWPHWSNESFVSL